MKEEDILRARILLSQRKEKASELLKRIEELGSLHGITKLQKKITAENNFLLSLDKDDITMTELESHLKSSNLSYLEAVLTSVEYLKNTNGVLKKFNFSSGENHISDVVVDVVGHEGKLWLKAFARNPYALHHIWEGVCQYGVKDVCKLAREYQNAAKQNCIDYVIPEIVFLFASGITKSVAEDLESMGIKIMGKKIDDPSGEEKFTRNNPLDDYRLHVITDLMSLKVDHLKQTKVNLDITTLIALVSSLTNGHCHYEFEDDVLNMQGEQEHSEPLLPILNSFLQGKVLYVCKTALVSFQNILGAIGGEKENERAKELLTKVTIVDDYPSVQALQLPKTARIKDRSKVIFGTGDKLQAITSTANKSFVRAAHDQGVDFSVFLHASRALAEKKEKRVKVMEQIY